jgi:hypothetical protein
MAATHVVRVDRRGVIRVEDRSPSPPDGTLVGRGDPDDADRAGLREPRADLEASGATFADVVKIRPTSRRSTDCRACATSVPPIPGEPPASAAVRINELPSRGAIEVDVWPSPA